MEQNSKITLYAVLRMTEEVYCVLETKYKKIEEPINLKWLDGMVGAIPVFDDVEKAYLASEGIYKICPLEAYVPFADLKIQGSVH